jgi:N-acetylglucosamine-6-phosphate deacetylase
VGDVTIRGALVFGRDAATTGDLVVRGGRVLAPGAADAGPGEVLDAAGLIVAPGLVDLQVNGHGADDLTARPDSVDAVAAALLDEGVTAFCPTLVSSDDATRAVARATQIARRTAERPGAAALGWHLEGPVISRAGAHDASAIGAVPLDVGAWTADWVRLVTLAPEVPDAGALIDALVARGITVALGHTGASAACVEDAITRGATMVTHLFNAMAPLHQREPGVVGVALTDARVVATMIVDGAHVDARVLALAWRALGPARLALVSDAVATTLGGRAPAPGELAGGRVSLLGAVRNLVHDTGCRAEDAIRAASEVPARAVGCPDRGHLRAGAVGDVLLLTPGLDLVGVVRQGVVMRQP